MERTQRIKETMRLWRHGKACSHMNPDMDARHVEAWMLVNEATLDALTSREFCLAVRLGMHVVETAGDETSEALAQSWGL